MGWNACGQPAWRRNVIIVLTELRLKRLRRQFPGWRFSHCDEGWQAQECATGRVVGPVGTHAALYVLVLVDIYLGPPQAP